MSMDDVRKKATQLAKSFDRLAKIKGGHAKEAEQLELALQALPDVDAYAAARVAIQEEAQARIAAIRRGRASEFNTHLAEFIAAMRDEGTVVRETGAGWRIGSVELELRAEGAKCRVLYSREEVIGWKDVRSPADIAKVLRDARSRLTALEIDERYLADLMWEAYQARRPTTGRRVRLIDFFEELRVVLVRREVKGAAHRRLRFAEFPKWAALYNMDRYIAVASSIPEAQRLIPETGSQLDVQRGLGCLLNGLNPQLTPMTYCYIHSLH